MYRLIATENMKTYCSWEDLKLAQNFSEAIVLSSGYEKRNFLSSRFEQFKDIRKIKMKIDYQWNILIHPWLLLDEPIEDVNFFIEDGILYADDPELYTRQ